MGTIVIQIDTSDQKPPPRVIEKRSPVAATGAARVAILHSLIMGPASS